MLTPSHPLTWLTDHFGEVEDPRLDRHKAHQLLDIIGLTIIGVLSGADNFVSIEQFGLAKLDRLKDFLSLDNGIPSHDTLGRCFSLLDPQQVEDGFVSWVTSLSQLAKGEIVAIDGKVLRGSHDRHHNKYAIHMGGAWAVGNGLSLGQVKVDHKSNEITAIPKLLEILDLEGCVVTIDAMGTQKDIASKIIDKRADYVLALKENHPELYAEVEKSFAHLAGSANFPLTEQWDKGHGRIESRRCCVLDVNHPDFEWILAEDLAPWTGLSSIIMIESHRWRNEEHSVERRYYLSSLRADRNTHDRFQQVIRSHWAIENNLHWCLDVTFREDQARVRTKAADQNMAVIRRLVLNLLKKEKTLKVGLQNKRMRAAWDDQYLLKLLDAGKV